MNYVVMANEIFYIMLHITLLWYTYILIPCIETRLNQRFTILKYEKNFIEKHKYSYYSNEHQLQNMFEQIFNYIIIYIL